MISQINFGPLVQDLIAIAALLAAVFVVIAGCVIILDFLRGPEFGSVRDFGDFGEPLGDDLSDNSSSLLDDSYDEAENPLGKSLY